MTYRTISEDFARIAWGPVVPPWVMALARACDTRGTVVVAFQLGVETRQVTLAVDNALTEGADIEQRVQQALLASAVDCPVLGFMKRQACLVIQGRPEDSVYSPPLRKALLATCPTCTHCRAKEASHAV